jgi:nitrogen fixation protein NifU and related proteins
MYSERLLAFFHARAHEGPLENPTHYGQGGLVGHGPYLQLWLRIDGGRVEAIRFQTYGCPAAMACGEALCRMLEGRPLDKISQVRPELVNALVGGVPEGKEHCPELAVAAWDARRPV